MKAASEGLPFCPDLIQIGKRPLSHNCKLTRSFSVLSVPQRLLEVNEN